MNTWYINVCGRFSHVKHGDYRNSRGNLSMYFYVSVQSVGKLRDISDLVLSIHRPKNL